MLAVAVTGLLGAVWQRDGKRSTLEADAEQHVVQNGSNDILKRTEVDSQEDEAREQQMKAKTGSFPQHQ